MHSYTQCQKTGIQGYMPLYYDQTAQRTKLHNQCNVPHPICNVPYHSRTGLRPRTDRDHVTRAQVLPNLATASLQVLYGLCLFDVVDIAMPGENKTFIFLFVGIPKLSSLGVERARAVSSQYYSHKK